MRYTITVYIGLVARRICETGESDRMMLRMAINEADQRLLERRCMEGGT